MMHVPTTKANDQDYENMLWKTRVPGLFYDVLQVKSLIQMMGSLEAQNLARLMGCLETKK